jgi:hypothetical protein
MPTWSDVETQIPAAIREAAQDSELQVVWGEQSDASSWLQAVHVSLRLRAMSRVGHGERLYTDESGSAREVVRWPRLLTFQVMVETQDQRLANAALALADTVHAGLRFDAAHAALAVAGLALGTSGPMRLVDYTDNHGRRRSAVLWEIEINAATAVTGQLTGWMASVEYEAEITREDETVLDLGPTEIVLP